jgi:CheY-like chemotaxis protein
MEASTIPFALVVDDDPFILMDACGILEDVGFRCHSADHGDAAKAMLPDMPRETDGFALAHHVAARWPWIEIVIASGRIKPNDGDMPEKATFIGKPFSAALVRNHLREKLPDGKKPEPLKAAV